MTRTALIGAAVGALLLCITGVGLATAATTPSALCRQMQDRAGDAQLLGGNNPTGLPQVPSLDIVSADLATTAKTVRVAIRLASLTPDPVTSFGSTYTFTWTVAGVTQSLSYRTFADAPPDAVFDADTGTGSLLDLIRAGFTVDRSTNTIGLSVPRNYDAVLRSAEASRLAFTDLQARTSAGVNRSNGTTQSGFDDARQAKAYVDRTPTCLKGA